MITFLNSEYYSEKLRPLLIFPTEHLKISFTFDDKIIGYEKLSLINYSIDLSNYHLT